MHTSLITLSLFWSAVLLVVATQISGYAATPRVQRTWLKKTAFVIGLSAAAVSAAAGYFGAVDWDELPGSPAGLKQGQLWNNNGVPAIKQ